MAKPTRTTTPVSIDQLEIPKPRSQMGATTAPSVVEKPSESSPVTFDRNSGGQLTKQQREARGLANDEGAASAIAKNASDARTQSEMIRGEKETRGHIVSSEATELNQLARQIRDFHEEVLRQFQESASERAKEEKKVSDQAEQGKVLEDFKGGRAGIVQEELDALSKIAAEIRDYKQVRASRRAQVAAQVAVDALGAEYLDIVERLLSETLQHHKDGAVRIVQEQEAELRELVAQMNVRYEQVQRELANAAFGAPAALVDGDHPEDEGIHSDGRPSAAPALVDGGSSVSRVPSADRVALADGDGTEVASRRSDGDHSEDEGIHSDGRPSAAPALVDGGSSVSRVSPADRVALADGDSSDAASSRSDGDHPEDEGIHTKEFKLTNLSCMEAAIEAVSGRTKALQVTQEQKKQTLQYIMALYKENPTDQNYKLFVMRAALSRTSWGTESGKADFGATSSIKAFKKKLDEIEGGHREGFFLRIIEECKRFFTQLIPGLQSKHSDDNTMNGIMSEIERSKVKVGFFNSSVDTYKNEEKLADYIALKFVGAEAGYTDFVARVSAPVTTPVGPALSETDSFVDVPPDGASVPRLE